jgi:hypothetical protein
MPVVAIVVLAAAVGAVIAIARAAGGDDADGARTPPPGAATTAAAPTTVVVVPTRAAPAVPAAGLAFTDPQEDYTLTIGADWTEISSRMTAGTEAWAVAEGSSGVTPNVTVVTQPATDVDLEAYLATSVDDVESIDGELIEQSYVQRADGAMLGAMRYTATPAGGTGPLEFLAVIDVRDSTAVVATLTAPDDAFDAIVAEVEPYLFTLAASE